MLLNNDTISSRIIAEKLERKHKNVLRDLDKILINSNLNDLIQESYYHVNGQKRRYKEYLLTRDGLKLYLSKCQNITQEQYQALGIDDIDVVFSHTRFETSFGKMLIEALKEINLDIIPQYNVDGYRIDFYIPKLNIAVEYDEEQHFSKTNIKKDLDRQKYIENKIGAKFIRCDYRDSDIKNVMKVIKVVM